MCDEICLDILHSGFKYIWGLLINRLWDLNLKYKLILKINCFKPIDDISIQKCHRNKQYNINIECGDFRKKNDYDYDQ